jgi:Uma2 family endonuclease
MATMIPDSELERRLIDQRRTWGADKYDEVWEGVYVMAPLPNDEHQEIAARMVRIFGEIMDDAGLARVRAGVNLAAPAIEDWQRDFRVPDVAVFFEDTAARNYGTHWRGAADFLVEITSPNDRTREKIVFYSSIGVVELLVVERDGWSLELLRHNGQELDTVGISTVDNRTVLRSTRVPFAFQLIAGDKRPRVRVTHVETGRHWDV